MYVRSVVDAYANANPFPWKKMLIDFYLILLEYASWPQIDNKSALVLVMTWHRADPYHKCH